MTGDTLMSMTAYGAGEMTQGATTYACEIRSLNSRFLEVNVRLPRQMIALEIEVINHVKAQLKRGKVDVFLDTAKVGGTRDLPQLDEDAVSHYTDVLGKLGEMLAAKGLRPQQPLSSLHELLRLDGVLAADGKPRPRGDAGADAHREPVLAAVSAALERLKQARSKEGAALGVALLDLTQQLRASARQVEQRRGPLTEVLHKTYLKRLSQVLGMVQRAAQESGGEPIAIDDNRLLAEIAILIDKSDIEEELTRLATHIDEFERQLGSEDAPGRKLDFLCQELHREVNTISNKLVQTDISQHTIEMKQTIERIRQQVQNLE